MFALLNLQGLFGLSLQPILQGGCNAFLWNGHAHADHELDVMALD